MYSKDWNSYNSRYNTNRVSVPASIIAEEIDMRIEEYEIDPNIVDDDTMFSLIDTYYHHVEVEDDLTGDLAYKILKQHSLL